MSSLVDIPEILALALSLVTVSPGATDRLVAPDELQPMVPFVFKAFGREDRIWIRQNFKFTKQNWLRAVKQSSAVPRLKPVASRIFKTTAGRYYVPIEAERAGITALRGHGETALAVTRAQALQNKRLLGAKLRRAVQPVDLYIAHMVGSDTALRLIKLVKKRPEAIVAKHIPQLAFTDTSLFFNSKRGRTARASYQRLTKAFARSVRRAHVKIRKHGKSKRASPDRHSLMSQQAALSWSTVVKPAR